MNKNIFLISLSIFLFSVSNLQAKTSPSFDCSKASNEVEKLICSDDELAQLDVEMNKAYNNFMKTLDDNENVKKLKNKQKTWLRNRSKVICMKDTEENENKSCLEHIYETRIKRLNDWANRTDWSFFIDDSHYPEGYSIKFISKDAQEYVFYPYYGYSQTAEGMIYPFVPKENIIYYHRDYEALLEHGNMFFKDGILHKDEEKIIFWTGGKNTDTNSFTRKEIVPTVSYFEQKLNKKDIIKIIALLKEIYPSRLSEENKISDECMNIMNQIMMNNYKILLPNVIANSYEEIQSKYKTRCNKNNLLHFNSNKDVYTLYPPYSIYHINDKSFIIEGIPSNGLTSDMKSYKTSTSRYIYKSDCSFGNNLGASGDFLIKIGNSIYVITIPFIKQKLNNSSNKIVWTINDLNKSSNLMLNCYFSSE